MDDPFGLAGGAGGEHVHQRALPARGGRGHRFRRRDGDEVGQHGVTAGGGGSGDDDAARRVVRQVGAWVEFVALVGVDDHNVRTRAFQPQGDGLRRERGEQRDVDRAEPPDREDEGDQVGALAHQGRHPVAGTDAKPLQRSRIAVRVRRKLTEGQRGRLAGAVDDGERDAVRGVPVAQQPRHVEDRSGEFRGQFGDPVGSAHSCPFRSMTGRTRRLGWLGPWWMWLTAGTICSSPSRAMIPPVLVLRS